MSPRNPLPNTLLIRRNTAISSTPERYSDGDPDDRYPEGMAPRMLHLGTIEEGGQLRKVFGFYTILQQGYEVDDEPSACWVWCGNYRDGNPLIRTFYSTHYPRALMLKKVGVKGRMVSKCGHKNCINPAHLSVKSIKSVMKELGKKRKPQPRDARGRFLSPDSPPSA